MARYWVVHLAAGSSEATFSRDGEVLIVVCDAASIWHWDKVRSANRHENIIFMCAFAISGSVEIALEEEVLGGAPRSRQFGGGRRWGVGRKSLALPEPSRPRTKWGDSNTRLLLDKLRIARAATPRPLPRPFIVRVETCEVVQTAMAAQGYRYSVDQLRNRLMKMVAEFRRIKGNCYSKY